MYELGLSHAISKPVIMLSQSIDDVPFDLKSLRCLLYDTVQPDWAEQLRHNLTSYINIISSRKNDDDIFLKKGRDLDE